MTQLTNLCLKGNYLQSADDLRSILDVPSISVVDVQSNRIDDLAVLDIFEKMPNLKVLYLQGNPVVKQIKQYRKTVISRCAQLKYLDDRPIFDDERRRVTAWSAAMSESGGDVKKAIEAERAEMTKIREEKKLREDENFRQFEEMMIRARDEKESVSENTKNPFSGESIIPSEDCRVVRQAREERWRSTVGESVPPPPPESLAPPHDQNKQIFYESDSVNPSQDSEAPIKVSSERLNILQQCANIGSTNMCALKSNFVGEHFLAEPAIRPPDSSNVALPPPPVTVMENGMASPLNKAKDPHLTSAKI